MKAAREAEPSPPEPKPPEAKPVEQKQAEVKPDPIADKLAKEEAKKPEPKKAEAKPPMPPKKPAPPAPKFDAKKVEALLDKREATRMAAAGDMVNPAPSVGMPNAHRRSDVDERARSACAGGSRVSGAFRRAPRIRAS